MTAIHLVIHLAHDAQQVGHQGYAGKSSFVNSSSSLTLSNGILSPASPPLSASRVALLPPSPGVRD